jgi:hypothetical protein
MCSHEVATPPGYVSGEHGPGRSPGAPIVPDPRDFGAVTSGPAIRVVPCDAEVMVLEGLKRPQRGPGAVGDADLPAVEHELQGH